MGYSGKLDNKIQAQELRRQGLSYKEILQTISVSKDTLSRWCKDIELTEAQKLRLLSNKQSGQRKGSLVAAENKRQQRIVRTKQIKIKAKEEIGELFQRDMFITGIALYAAEGDKTDGKGGFANADPKIIQFMATWFCEFAKIPKEKLRGALYLHENLEEIAAKNYWSNISGIPLSQFRKTYIVKRKNTKQKFRKNIHEYGIFSIRFSDSTIHRQIIGWISAMFDARISLHSAIAQR